MLLGGLAVTVDRAATLTSATTRDNPAIASVGSIRRPH